MNSSAPSGQVLSAGVSVLPATAASTLLTNVQLANLTETVLVFAGIWAISYVAFSGTLRLIRK
jgi:hypothetical protein